MVAVVGVAASTKKRAPAFAGPDQIPLLEGSLFRRFYGFIRNMRAGVDAFRLGFASVQLPSDIGANRP